MDYLLLLTFLVATTTATSIASNSKSCCQNDELPNENMFSNMESNDLFKSLYGVYKTDKYATICWNVKTVLNFFANGTTNGYMESSISMELAPVPPPPVTSTQQAEPYEVCEEGSHDSRVLTFVTVKKDDQLTVKQNCTIECKTDQSYTEHFVQSAEKKRVDIKLKSFLNADKIRNLSPADVMSSSEHPITTESGSTKNSKTVPFTVLQGRRMEVTEDESDETTTEDDLQYTEEHESTSTEIKEVLNSMVSEQNTSLLCPQNGKVIVKLNLTMMDDNGQENLVEKDVEIDLHNGQQSGLDIDTALVSLVKTYYKNSFIKYKDCVDVKFEQPQKQNDEFSIRSLNSKPEEKNQEEFLVRSLQNMYDDYPEYNYGPQSMIPWAHYYPGPRGRYYRMRKGPEQESEEEPSLLAKISNRLKDLLI